MRWGLVCLVLASACPIAIGAAAAPAPRGTIAYTLAVDVWTVSADGTKRTRVTRGGLGSGPSWSADGTRLLVESRHDSGLAILRADGTRLHSISLPVGAAVDPDWARDGRIAFVMLHGGPFGSNSRPNGIWVMDEDGSGLREVVFGYQPAWAPDGTRIAYTERVSADEWAVAIVSADGGASTRLASGKAPAWSPTGRRLAYVDPSGGIVVANADGSAARKVVACGGSPAWSPDGRWLAYLSCRRDFRTQLYLVPSAGGTPTRLTRYAGSYRAPDWRPGSPAEVARASRP